jgi:glycogen debranching enzyme
VAPELFEEWQARSLLERVRAELLTPHGVRSLSPSDRFYAGHFAGDPEEREYAYHQGTAWPHLLGFYARAVANVEGEDMAHAEALRELIARTVDAGNLLGQVPQLADGDPPHRPRGSPAQATSVAELLRALHILGG